MATLKNDADAERAASWITLGWVARIGPTLRKPLGNAIQEMLSLNARGVSVLYSGISRMDFLVVATNTVDSS